MVKKNKFLIFWENSYFIPRKKQKKGASSNGKCSLQTIQALMVFAGDDSWIRELPFLRPLYSCHVTHREVATQIEE